jgi:hypothetical protein
MAIEPITLIEGQVTIMPADESLWPSLSHHSKGITSGTFYGNLQRYFKKAGITPSGVHICKMAHSCLNVVDGRLLNNSKKLVEFAVDSLYWWN